jgi:hypothetical protein
MRPSEFIPRGSLDFANAKGSWSTEQNASKLREVSRQLNPVVALARFAVSPGAGEVQVQSVLIAAMNEADRAPTMAACGHELQSRASATYARYSQSAEVPTVVVLLSPGLKCERLIASTSIMILRSYGDCKRPPRFRTLLVHPSNRTLIRHS